jgi:hypothetical protein
MLRCGPVRDCSSGFQTAKQSYGEFCVDSWKPLRKLTVLTAGGREAAAFAEPPGLAARHCRRVVPLATGRCPNRR